MKIIFFVFVIIVMFYACFVPNLIGQEQNSGIQQADNYDYEIDSDNIPAQTHSESNIDLKKNEFFKMGEETGEDPDLVQEADATEDDSLDVREEQEIRDDTENN